MEDTTTVLCESVIANIYGHVSFYSMYIQNIDGRHFKEKLQQNRVTGHHESKEKNKNIRKFKNFSLPSFRPRRQGLLHLLPVYACWKAGASALALPLNREKKVSHWPVLNIRLRLLL